MWTETDGVGKTGHIHGRFQPFHDEHLDYARWAGEHCDRLLVGVTNADPSHVEVEDADSKRHEPKHNPFTYHERHRIISAALAAASVDAPTSVIPFPINRPELWAHYVPEDAVHFVNVLEPWHKVKTERLVRHGRRVRTKSGTRTISGTDIRERMASDEPWRHLVPDAAVDVIDDIDGVQRVKRLYREE